MSNLGTSSKKACAIYSDMNKLQNDISNGLWSSSDYAIIYVEDLAYIYLIDGYANNMKINNSNIINKSTNQIAEKQYTPSLSKVNLAYLNGMHNYPMHEQDVPVVPDSGNSWIEGEQIEESIGSGYADPSWPQL